MRIEEYHVTPETRVRIIKDRKELESLYPRLELNPKKIFRTYVTVLEEERARVVIGKDEGKSISAIKIYKWRATSISLESSYKKGDHKVINLKALVSHFRDKLGCSYSQKEVLGLCKGEYDSDKKGSRPLPYVLYAIQDKASTHTILAWPEALEHLFTETETPEALGQGNVTYYKIDFDNNTLQRFSKLYPQLITEKLEQAQEAIEYINTNVKSRVILNSDNAIEPTKDNSKLTNLKIIKANTVTPKANELKDEGTHNFLIGNVLDTEVQMLAEYQNQLDIQYYLNRINTDDDAYRLFVFPKSLTNYRHYDKYRLQNTFKLFKTLFKEYQIQEEYPIRPIEEFPVPSDITKSKNPIVAAIKYYLETGKAISYVHFK